MNRLRSIALAASLATSALAAHAGVVDLFGLPGNFDQTTFGSTSSYYYAQSVKADAANWADLKFSVGKSGAGGTFNLLITKSVAGGLPGTGLIPDAANVLSSTQLTHTGTGAEVFDLALNQAVTAGETYFFVLQGVGGTLSDASVLASEFFGTDKYADGEFIFSNSDVAIGASPSWSSRFDASEDLVFRAEFNGGTVPEPGPLALLAIAALAAGLTRRTKTSV
jgi:hypothetical protein